MTDEEGERKLGDLFLRRGAVFSPCGKYRNSLTREWDSAMPKLVFIMLNPSTATDEVDDPTVAGCMKRGRMWGYGSLTVLNLFQYRSTDPKALRQIDDPVGPASARWLLLGGADAAMTVAAWGNHGTTKGIERSRCCEVIAFLCGTLGRALHALRLTQAGQPEHPLYIPHHIQPKPWMDRKRFLAGEHRHG